MPRKQKKLYKIEKNGCWTGLRAKNQGGYPVIRINKILFIMSRYMYEKFKGKISKNKQLDHLCRNRQCVNPNHLEIVSQAENIRRGESSKLNKKIVGMIKVAYKFSHKSQTEIAKAFNVNQSTISRIVNNLRWKGI